MRMDFNETLPMNGSTDFNETLPINGSLVANLSDKGLTFHSFFGYMSYKGRVILLL